MNLEIIEDLKTTIKRWENHQGFLEVLRKSDIDKKIVDEWEERINCNFKFIIKSKL